MISMIDLSDLREAWKLPPILRTWTPETGATHRTLLLRTTEGDYALRGYRYNSDAQWRIVCEHTLIAFAQASGLPVPAPVPLPTGETILKQKGHFYALFPFARGRQIPRGHLATSEVIAMGRFLGELHRVLHGYPHEQVPHRSFIVDEAATLASIDTIEAAIRSQFHIDDDDRQVLSRLAERRAWLTTTPPINTEEFSQLEQQVIHGDYQETNLFFEGGQISAIIDWDQSYVAPRAWEIVRTLHYALRLEPAACHTFLHAYRRVLPLTTTELDVAATAYGWKRGHDLWHYEELYLKGNQRVRAFFQPKGSFIPFEEKWKKLKHSLLES